MHVSPNQSLRRATTVAAVLLSISTLSTSAVFAGGPSCELQLSEALGVKGINSAWIAGAPFRTPVVDAMGFASPDMSAAIDATVANYMNEFNLPGGVVAMTFENHLIFAKAYGWANVLTSDGVWTEPDSRFRVASVSKSLTAMATLKAVHDGLITLNDHPFPCPSCGQIIAGGPGNLHYDDSAYNQQLDGITVDDLLHHAGGWDRNIAPDLTGYPILQSLASFLTATTGIASGPPDCRGLLSYVESQPLQFTPGTETHYSNVGFCALSAYLATKSGVSFGAYLETNVLQKLGMIDTQLGFTPQAEALDREVTYYDTTDPSAASLFPPYSVTTAPYSTMGAIESQGGAAQIVTTAIDLARFAGSIATADLPELLSTPSHKGWPRAFYVDSETVPSYECSGDIPPYASSAACPPGWSPDWEKGHWVFGMGWDQVLPGAVTAPLLPFDNNNFIKDGGFPGTVSSLAVTADGYGFAAVFNANDNTVPAPQDYIFWPGCATGAPPQPAASANNCALQAAYNHASTSPWSLDFHPEYSKTYTGWMSPSALAAMVKKAAAAHSYPSRLEGKAVTPTKYEYRVRMSSSVTEPAPRVLYGQTCTSVLSAVKASTPSTPLVSLQRFAGSGGSFVYQAIFAGTIPGSK